MFFPAIFSVYQCFYVTPKYWANRNWKQNEVIEWLKKVGTELGLSQVNPHYSGFYLKEINSCVKIIADNNALLPSSFTWLTSAPAWISKSVTSSCPENKTTNLCSLLRYCPLLELPLYAAVINNVLPLLLEWLILAPLRMRKSTMPLCPEWTHYSIQAHAIASNLIKSKPLNAAQINAVLPSRFTSSILCPFWISHLTIFSRPSYKHEIAWASISRPQNVSITIHCSQNQ